MPEGGLRAEPTKRICRGNRRSPISTFHEGGGEYEAEKKPGPGPIYFQRGIFGKTSRWGDPGPPRKKTGQVTSKSEFFPRGHGDQKKEGGKKKAPGVLRAVLGATARHRPKVSSGPRGTREKKKGPPNHLEPRFEASRCFPKGRNTGHWGAL